MYRMSRQCIASWWSEPSNRLGHLTCIIITTSCFEGSFAPSYFPAQHPPFQRLA